MDKPQVDRVDGMPPAIAIDQTNPVRTSRSTVGTMTELNDHLKLLFARAAAAVRPQDGAAGAPRHAGDDLRRADGAHARRTIRAWSITFPVELPANTTRRGSRAVAVGERLHARAGASAKSRRATGAAQDARSGGRPLPHAERRRSVARDRGDRGRAQARRGARERLRAAPTTRRSSRRSGASPPACTAPTATSATPSRSRRCSRSTRRSAPARPAAASAA